MTEQNEYGQLKWDETTHDNFQKILQEIPPMIRGIAEVRVLKKAESIVTEDGRNEIGEKDMVDAFFAETPGGFLPPLKLSMEELGIDYAQYGHV